MHALPVTRFATLELPTVLGLLSSPPVRPGSSPHNLYSLAAGYRLPPPNLKRGRGGGGTNSSFPDPTHMCLAPMWFIHACS